MAIVKAVDVSLSLQNTSVEGSSAMGAAAMLLVMPKTLKFSAANVADFVNYVDAQSHALGSSRIYPFFGNNAPIRTINVNDEDDVMEKFDDGSEIYVRTGYANRVYETTEGSLDYAKKMRSFLNANYAFVEVDKEGKFCVKKNTDGTFSGFAFFGGGKSPVASSFKTVYRNRFMISYDLATYISSGEIYTGADGLLALTGLQNVKTASAGTASTTNLKVAVSTVFAGTDLVSLIGSGLAMVSNFIINKVSDASVVTPSACIIESGYIKLTGVYASASHYTVKLAAAATLFTNGVEGYEQSADTANIVDFLIP